jgi:hypothetical protein
MFQVPATHSAIIMPYAYTCSEGAKYYRLGGPSCMSCFRNS